MGMKTVFLIALLGYVSVLGKSENKHTEIKESTTPAEKAFELFETGTVTQKAVFRSHMPRQTKSEEEFMIEIGKLMPQIQKYKRRSAQDNKHREELKPRFARKLLRQDEVVPKVKKSLKRASEDSSPEQDDLKLMENKKELGFRSQSQKRTNKEEFVSKVKDIVKQESDIPPSEQTSEFPSRHRKARFIGNPGVPIKTYNSLKDFWKKYFGS